MKIAIICFQEYDEMEHIYYDISGVNERKWLRWIGGEFIGFTDMSAKKVVNAEKNVKNTIKQLKLELKLAEKNIERNKNNTKEDWEKLDKKYRKETLGMSGYFILPSEEWEEEKNAPRRIKQEIKKAEEVLCL